MGVLESIANRDIVMTTTNSHNPYLVDLINEHWGKDRDGFEYILSTLYCRDEDEMEEKGIVEGDWEDKAYSYLMNVADDKDLVTILNYLRDDRVEYRISK